jgi:ADP-ribose pyrophosphatase
LHCKDIPYTLIHIRTGLIDEGETAEQAAFRELEEETGFRANKVLQISPVIVSDPGQSPAVWDYVWLLMIVQA